MIALDALADYLARHNLRLVGQIEWRVINGRPVACVAMEEIPPGERPPESLEQGRGTGGERSREARLCF